MNAFIGFIALLVVAIAGWAIAEMKYKVRKRCRGRRTVGERAPCTGIQGNEYPRHHAQQLYQRLQCSRIITPKENDYPIHYHRYHIGDMHHVCRHLYLPRDQLSQKMQGFSLRRMCVL